MVAQRLSNHVLLCSRGASTRNAPLPVMSVHSYLHGAAMHTRRHYTQLAQTIAKSMCGRKGGTLWDAVYRTPPRDWTEVVLLVDNVPVIDWGNIILVDYSDRSGWGDMFTRLVVEELRLIAMRGRPL